MSVERFIFRWEVSLIVEVTSNRWRKSQLAGISGRAVAKTLENWSREGVHSVILFSWPKHFCLIEIHCQLFEACGDGLVGVLHVRKRCGDFLNS